MGHEEQLGRAWIFSKLDQSDLQRISKAIVPRQYKAGDTIVNEGEPAVAFYVIASGRVEVTKGGQPIATMGAGDAFGEMALLDGFPRATSVVAKEDTECLVMTRWDFTAELRSNPNMAMQLLPVLSKRIRELEVELERLTKSGASAE